MKHPAKNLQERQRQARDIVSQNFRNENIDLIDAQQSAFSALASMLDRRVGEEVKDISEADQGSMALIAQFIVGIEQCKISIEEGLYAQAAALLKQELETVSAIEEYRNDRRKEGKTPKIGHGLTQNYGKVYGRLNEICHPSRHDWAKTLAAQKIEKVTGANILVAYNGTIARFLYGQHVIYLDMIVQLAASLLHKLYGSSMNSQEIESISMTKMLLLSGGIVASPPEFAEDFANWQTNYLKNRNDKTSN